MPYWTKMEKAFVTGLASLALMMFFFPLLVIQAPLIGDQNVSGYNIFSKTKQFSGRVDDASSRPESASQTPGASEAHGLPLSLRLAGLIPLEVTTAFVLSIVVFLGAMSTVKVSYLAAIFAAILACVAVFHILIADSDLHTWLAASFQGTEDLKGNPFAGLAQQFGNIMFNAFKLRPGGGLYILVVSMLLIAMIAKTRMLSRFKIVSAGASSLADNSDSTQVKTR